MNGDRETMYELACSLSKANINGEMCGSR